MTRPIPEKLLGYSRSQRRDGSPIEGRLWSHINNRQLCGYKFRRQYVIASYIADFACLEKMLVIELDGDTHAGREAYDARRAKEIEASGYKVIRFSNSEIYHELDAVLDTILAVLEGKIKSYP